MAIRRLEMDASNGGKSLARLGVSTTEASGAAKTGMELFAEVVEKLNSMTDAGQRSEAAFTLLGRGAQQLLGVLPQLNEEIAKSTEEQARNTAINKETETESLALHAKLTELEAAWENSVTKVSPLVVGALEAIKREMNFDADVVDKLTHAVMALGNAFQTGIGQFNAYTSSALPAIQKFKQDQADYWKSVQHQLAGGAGQDALGLGGMEGGGTAVSDQFSRYSSQPFRGMGQQGMDVPEEEHAAWAPKAGGKGRGGGGGADPMAGMDNALDKANDQMTKFNGELEKLGSEASMAAKEGGASFDTLRDKAQQDYLVMQDKYKQFTDAVNSGSKQAAQQADQAWHLAAQHFQTDWEQAKQKAEQDMKQIKSAADTMASEVSSVLNSAISGKLNWQQEAQKVLEKIVSDLAKYCSEMIAKWIAMEEAKLAATQTAATQSVAIGKAAHAETAVTDAAAAAQGAWNSASHIPYIGWLVAPVAAAASFAGVEAFGSAEGGSTFRPGSVRWFRCIQGSL